MDKHNPEKKRKIVENQEEESHITGSALAAIYKDGEENVDMTTFEKRPKYYRLKRVGIVLAALLILGGLSFGVYSFMQRRSASEKNAADSTTAMTIEGPEQVSSGEKVTYTITLKNRESVPLKPGTLEVRYPNGFLLESIEPKGKNAENTQWDIPELKSNETYAIKIKAQLLGEVHTKKDLRAIWDFQPENFSSNFQKEEILSISIEESVARVEIDAPKKAIGKQKLQIELKVKNTSKSTLKEVQLKVELPEEYALTSSKPKATEEKTWVLQNIEAQKDTTVTLEGDVKAEKNKKLTFKADVYLKDAKGDWRLQQETKHEIAIIDPSVNTTFAINNKEDDGSFEIGDVLDFSFTYKNNSDLLLKNAELQLKLEGDTKLLDLTKFRFSGKKSPEVKDNTIIWTKENFDSLEKIEPGKEASIEWSIPSITSSEALGKDAKNLKITSNAVFNFDLEDADIKKEDFPDKKHDIISRLASEATILSEARYYDDDRSKVGSGPLPPEANSSTSFRIYWRLQNTMNDLEKGVVKMQLPADITWDQTAKAETGSITYNIEDRTVVWSIPKIAAHTNPADGKMEAYFNVTAHPTQDDLGKVIILSGEANFTAKDSFTGDDVTAKGTILNSDIPSDPIGKGQGTVVSGSSSSKNSNTNSTKNSNANSNSNTNN